LLNFFLKYLTFCLAGIPTLHSTSTIGDYTVMIIDYLDKNLEEILHTMKERKFSLKTVLMIADQIVILI